MNTPLPWVVERHDQDDGSINYEIWSQKAPNYSRICTISEAFDSNAALEDAKLIVAAVNLFGDLVKLFALMDKADEALDKDTYKQKRKDDFDRANPVQDVTVKPYHGRIAPPRIRQSICPGDKRVCYVGKGRDAHWRCGTVQCGRDCG